jgi:hypothetical protein
MGSETNHKKVSISALLSGILYEKNIKKIDDDWSFKTISVRLDTHSVLMVRGSRHAAAYAYDGAGCAAGVDAAGDPLRVYTWGDGIDNLLAVTVIIGSVHLLNETALITLLARP